MYKRLTYLVTHFKCQWANTRAQPDLRLRGKLCIGGHPQSGGVGLPRGFQHTMTMLTHQPSPACMGGSHDLAAAVRKQNG